MKQTRLYSRIVKHYIAIILTGAMILGQVIPVAAYTGTGSETEGALLQSDTLKELIPDSSEMSAGDTTDDEDVSVEDSELSDITEGLSEEPLGTLNDDITELLPDKINLDEISEPDELVDQPEELIDSAEGIAEGFYEDAADNDAIMYTLGAGLLSDTDTYKYPGVYTVRALSSDKVTDNMTIGIPSISNTMLAGEPTTESPAIIMGAALPYEEKTGPTDYRVIEGGKLYAPYEYFRYQIIEEANLNGEGGTHKKMSGFDGTYVIIRVDVSDFINGAENGSYLHVKQDHNKALMVRIGQEAVEGRVSFADAGGNETASYLISENRLVKKDTTGAYTDGSYIDVILLSSGTLVQGADTGSSTDPRAPLADFGLSFYIDDTQDYDPTIEWNSSLGTAVNRRDGKAITLTDEETKAGITTSDKVLDKFYKEDMAAAALKKSKYTIKGSDIELEMMVESGLEKPQYWSLKKGMESEYAADNYNGKPLKLICEAPLLNSISVAGEGRDVILDVNSFDIQLANHSKTNAAALKVDDRARLTIQDTFNTTGAELAVGNNATMEVTNGARLIIANTAQLEVEYDAASVAAGTEPAPGTKLNNGVITVKDGGIIENNGIITVEGREGKPQNAAEAGTVVRDYSNARLTIGDGGTIENHGCMLVNGELYNLGTLINDGSFDELITSYDPDKNQFTYHKGLQLSWKDDITQGQTYGGELYNGIDDRQKAYPAAKIVNKGDIVMVPGVLENCATLTNEGNIYMCAVDEIVIPITPYPDQPLVTEKRIKLGYDEYSVLLNDKGAILNNSGNIGTAKIEIPANGTLGKITEYKSDYIDDLNIRGYGKVNNSGTISVNALYAYSDVTNTGDGVIDRVIVCSDKGSGSVGKYTDSSSERGIHVYNAVLTEGEESNVWEFSPLKKIEIKDRIQSADPGETVSWNLILKNDAPEGFAKYLLRVDLASPYENIDVKEVIANDEVMITSPPMKDIKGNAVFILWAENAADLMESSTGIAAVVRVNGTGYIRPTAMQGPGKDNALVYNGREQQLVTKGSIPGGKVLYSCEGLEPAGFSEEIPTAKDAGTYTVTYKTVDGEGNPLLDEDPKTITVNIDKRDAYIAADDLVSVKGGDIVCPDYISYGIMDDDMPSIFPTVRCTDDKNNPVTTPITVDYTPNANYNIFTYEGKYTVLPTGDCIRNIRVQSVMNSFGLAHTISVNTTYLEESTDSSKKATVYYWTDENTASNNTIAATYGGVGVGKIYYKISTPDGWAPDGAWDTNPGMKPIVIVKADQAAPEKLQGTGSLVGMGGQIHGLVPFTANYTSMEYRRADETAYTIATSDTANVPAGTYYVRYSGDEHFNPSPDVEVTVTEPVMHNVRFDSRGGNKINDINGLIYGDLIEKPADPVRGGYKFIAWYTDESFTKEYNFDKIINGYDDPLVLYAGWKFDIPEVSKEDEEVFSKDIEGSTVSRNKTDDTVSVTIDGQEISAVTTDKDGKVTVKSQIWVSGLEDSYTYTGNAIKPVIHVYDGLKRLTEKTDYSVKYKDNTNAALAGGSRSPRIIIKFKGNYQGNKEQKVEFTIAPARIGNDPGADIEVYDISIAPKSSNRKQEPVPHLIWKSTGKDAKSKFFTVTYDRDVTAPGIYTATVNAKDSNYTGTATAKVIVADKNLLLSKGKTKISHITYTGKEIVPNYNEISFRLNNIELVPGRDYRIRKVYNNIEPGNAYILLEAVEGNSAGYTGTKVTKFKIRKGRELNEGEDFRYVYNDEVPYSKAGAKPAIKVYDRDRLLTETVDYSLSYKSNKKVTTATAPAIVEITGRGKYKKTVKKSFSIVKQNINRLDITAADQFVKQDKYKKPTLTIIDDGKKLGSKDYTVVGEPVFSTENGNTVVTVSVNGIGDYYTGSTSVQFRLMDSSFNISKAKAYKNISIEYTGKEMILNTEDLNGLLYLGNKLDPTMLKYNTDKSKSDFEVVKYEKNTDKGTAKVTVHGLNKYAGTKTITFKIVKKNTGYKGVLIGGKWK